MKSLLVLCFTAVLLFLAQAYAKPWKRLEVFDWDQGGYFSYLPARFLYHDAGRPDSLAKLVEREWSPEKGPHLMNSLGMSKLPNGNYITKYPMGVAVSQLPWFGLAHGYARLHGDPLNGFSRPYQHAAMLAGLFYGVLGLWVLRELLRRYYSDEVTAWVLAGIGLGTNFFVYASYEAVHAHAVLFLWHALLLYCTARWYERPGRRWALGMGLFLGLATLCRFTEALYVLLPLTWGLSSGAAWRQRLPLWGRHAGQLALGAGLGAVVVSAQFFFWHAVSGQWVLNGYYGEYFDFRHPHILEGLLSIEKGWFVYTPLMALTLAAGLPLLRRYVPAALPATLVVVPVALYVTFSWEQWGYGWTFSARPLVSLYPLLALSLAALLAAVLRPGSWGGVALRGLVAACILLSLLQTWQYSKGILPGVGETAKLYQERFFWVKFPPAPTPPTP
jgi:hypothetical protein